MIGAPMRRRGRAILGILCASFLLVCGPARAQEPAPASRALLAPLGLAQFPPLYRRAIDTYFAAAAAYRERDYAAAQARLEALWSAVPPGDPAWKKLQRESAALLSTADFGTPAAYSALRMLSDCVAWRLKSARPPLPETKVQMTVVLIGRSTAPEPTTLGALERGEGRSTTSTLDPALAGPRTEAIFEEAYWLFDEYLLAITQGRARIERTFVRLPEHTVRLGLRRGAVVLSRAESERVHAALPKRTVAATDGWHLVYPSHVPKAAAFSSERFVTGGMRRGPAPGDSPCFVSEDLKLLRTAHQNGRHLLSAAEREVALSQWLQHEFFHFLFSSYRTLRLEATPHSWQDRRKWPDDFVGSLEADYFAEALHKRLLPQTGLRLRALGGRAGSRP
ncbi:MAG: hypothetical protein U0900_23250 [Myxococcota bacterium]